MLNAAIIGLGQVGMLFDEEKKRTSDETWTHFTAYKQLPELFNLVAAVDPDSSRRAKAQDRKPELRVYSSIKEMLNRELVDIVSICTPEAVHLANIQELLGSIKGFYLEKPISDYRELDAAQKVTNLIKDRRICIRVNYYKREEPMYKEMLLRIENQHPIHITVRYSGPFNAVGSHAVNLILSLMPHAQLKARHRYTHTEGDGFSAHFWQDGMVGELVYCGHRHNLIFEMEVITDSGKQVLENNLSILRSYSFIKSERYSGYHELRPVNKVELEKNEQRFVLNLREIAKDLSENKPDYRNLNDALLTQKVMHEIEMRAV